MRYINIETGEVTPAHLIGTTVDGRNLYSQQEGWLPNFAYVCDADGNWIEVTEADAIAMWAASNAIARLAMDPAPLFRLLDIPTDTDNKDLRHAVAMMIDAGARFTQED